MSSTIDHEPTPSGGLGEQDQHAAGSHDVTEHDISGGVGAPLLVAALAGLALTLAVLTPITGVRIGALLILGASVLAVGRLLTRRGGGAR